MEGVAFVGNLPIQIISDVPQLWFKMPADVSLTLW